MKTKINHLLGAVLSLLAMFVTLCHSLYAKAESLEPPKGKPAISSSHVPEGLTGSDWSSIRTEYQKHRHAAVPVEGKADTWEARNTGQHWRTLFDARGFETQPDSRGASSSVPSWKWGLELKSYGFAGDERSVKDRATVTTDKDRVTYRWDDTLSEWFVNDTRGLEHGFTIHQRPTSAASLNSRRSTLNVCVAVRGGLRPVIEADGHDVRFVNGEGVTVLTYGGLHVFDADGKEVSSKFKRVTFAENSLCLAVKETGARYPLTIDPIAQQAYLKASNTEAGDRFGSAVAISGDTIVVGAESENSSAAGVNGNESDNSARGAGAAYVFVRNGTVWSQQAYLKASNPDVSDEFGTSVAISGDTVVVGATQEGSEQSGAAYVFVRNGTVWSQQTYLKASNPQGLARFGLSVAISGDTIVVGAEQENSGATGVNGDQSDTSAPLSGAAYVFVRDGTAWSQQAYLKASNTGSRDYFGRSAAISGDTVVVGAYGENGSGIGVNPADNDLAEDAGAAYVFVRSGTTWSQQAYLKASNTRRAVTFGFSVAISSNTIVVGSHGEDGRGTGVNGDQSAYFYGDGAAYVFVRDGIAWSQQAYLKPFNERLFIATPFGSVPLERLFGFSVAISGDTVIVGSPWEHCAEFGVDNRCCRSIAVRSGAAYVFARSGTTWTEKAYLKASNTEGSRRGLDDVGDEFGSSVAISGGTAVVGARWEDSAARGIDGDQADNSALESGAGYIFDGLAGFHAPADRDGDGVPDGCDNCPDTPNADQRDSDHDGVGDVCDGCPFDSNKIAPGICGCGVSDTLDSDGDGIVNCRDNCPNTPNPDQRDSDGDGIGDACEPPDADQDGVPDWADNCPLTPNPGQEDADGDFIGDACDTCPFLFNFGYDSDADGVDDACDNCPFTPNPRQEDADGDGIGDVCDNCPTTYNPDQADVDGNGIGDACGGCPNASFANDGIVWHQPLARNGASEDTDPSAGGTVKYRFKRGSTIPIQIHALGCDGRDVTSNASVIGQVTVFGDSNCDGAADANAEPIDFNGIGGNGGVMDKIDSHLKYNLDTKSLPTTTQCYILRVTVTDTSTGEEKSEEVLLQAK